MAAPVTSVEVEQKICVTCFGTIRNRSYRMLNSETSLNQWGHIFKQLSVNLIGCICNVCTTKLNRICRLTEESKTKAQALLRERDRIVADLKELPGVKQVSPKQTFVGALIPITVIPNSTNSLFVTPNKIETPSFVSSEKMIEDGTTTKNYSKDFDEKTMATKDKEKYPVLMYVNKQEEEVIRAIFQKNQWTLLMKELTEKEKETLESLQINLKEDTVSSIKDFDDSNIDSNIRNYSKDSNFVFVKPINEFPGSDQQHKDVKITEKLTQPIETCTMDQSFNAAGNEAGMICDDNVEGVIDSEMSTDREESACSDFNQDYSINDIVIKKEVFDSDDDGSDVAIKNVSTDKMTTSDMEQISVNYQSADINARTVTSERMDDSPACTEESGSCDFKFDYTVVKTEVCDDSDPEENMVATRILKNAAQLDRMNKNTLYESISDKTGNKSGQEDNDNMGTKQVVNTLGLGTSGLVQQNISLVDQIDSVIKYLGDCMLNKPSLSGHLVKTCCVFLMEKDKGFSEWCENFATSKMEEADLQSTWKDNILEMAFKSDQLLVKEVLKRLTNIVKASHDSNFTTYFYGFLTSCKLLMMEVLGTAPKIPVLYFVPNLAVNSQTVTTQPVLAKQSQNFIGGSTSVISQNNIPPTIPIPCNVTPTVPIPCNVTSTVPIPCNVTPTTSAGDNTAFSMNSTLTYNDEPKREYYRPNWRLSRHSHRFPGQLKVLCSHCPKKFHSQKNLDFHMSKSHPELAEAVECYTCKEQFRYKQDLVRHGQDTRHRLYTPCMCEICGKELSSRNCLMSHIIAVHNTDDNTYMCEICSKVFKHKTSLNNHKQLVHSEEVWKCEICDGTFKSKRNLASHQVRHAPEKKRVKCPDCDKMFYFKTPMMQHRRIHTGEKPYKCTLCDYRTAFRNNIGKHMRVHQK